MVIPRSLRERAGIPEGTLLDVTLVEGGSILLTPQLTINRAIVTASPTNRKQAFRELARVVAEIRQEAKGKGLDTMPMKEINKAVAATRRDLKKTNKHPAK
jgi:bifunctional DNA-binding transcriptional regulator/antitoxin component of YhaV-PrlF toxin-antitoxin module